jgi:hypothetical protein
MGVLEAKYSERSTGDSSGTGAEAKVSSLIEKV